MIILYFKPIALAILSIACVVITNVAWAQTNVLGAGVYKDDGPEKKPSIVWCFDAGSHLLGTPQIYGDRVYITDFEGDVYALDKETGEVIWKKKLGGQPGFQFSMNDEVVVVKVNSENPPDPGYIVALDRITGAEFWRVKYESYIGVNSPLIYGDKVYFSSSYDFLASLDVETGKEYWRLPTRGDGQPLIYDNTLYVEDSSQTLNAVDVKNGDLLWNDSLHEIDVSWGSIPAVTDCCIYSIRSDSDRHRFMVQLNRQTGRIEKTIPLDFNISSPVVLKGDVAFFGDDGGEDKHGHMNAINIHTGEPVWQYETEGYVRGAASIAGNTVFFGSHDHFLYAVDLETGELKWRYETSGGIAASPAIVDGRVYVGNNDGYLYVLK